MTRQFSTHRRRIPDGWTSICLLVCVSAYGALATAEAAQQPGVEARSANAAPNSQPRSVWDGVYIEEQVEKGQVTYDRACSSCHKDDLSGDVEKFAPPLAGPAFTSRWNGRPLSDLYWKVALEQHRATVTMMKPREINETLTVILKANGLPAGRTILPDTFPDLEAILFTAAPPPAE